MDQELRAYLREQETVCWQGCPEPFPLLEGSSRKQILGIWAATAAVICGLLVWYFQFYQGRNVGLLGLMFLIGGLVAISPFLEKRSLQGQTYWITNQRVIVRTRDGAFHYMNLDGIDQIRLVKNQSDNGCLALGGIIFEDVEKQLRWRACHPKEDMRGQEEQECVLGMVLYDLRDAERVAAELGQRTCVAVA